MSPEEREELIAGFRKSADRKERSGSRDIRRARELRLAAQWLDDHPEMDPEGVVFHVDVEGNLAVHKREPAEEML